MFKLRIWIDGDHGSPDYFEQYDDFKKARERALKILRRGYETPWGMGDRSHDFIPPHRIALIDVLDLPD